MEFFRNILRFIFTFVIKQKLKNTQHQRKISGLAEANYIGILAEITGENDQKALLTYVSQLRKQGKHVELLAFIKNKIPAKLTEDETLTKKDLNLFGFPVGEKINHFKQRKFDLLINLYSQESLPLQYISALSAAFCRVGRYNDRETNSYDVMFSFPGEATLETFIRQLNHYLNQINKHVAQV